MNIRSTDTLAAFLSLLVPSLFTFGYFVTVNDPLGARILYGMARVFLICFPVLWTMFVDKKRFPLPRMKSAGVLSGLAVGAIITGTGLGLYFTVFDTLLPVEEVRQKAALFGLNGSIYIVYSILIIVGNASLEEYYWRWFNLFKLMNILPGKWAICVSALGFTLHHIIVLAIYFAWPYAAGFSLAVFTGGIIFAFLYQRYDNIWSPWICHAAIDAGIMIVGYAMIFSG